MTVRAFKGMAPKIHPSCFIEQSAQVIGDVEIGEQSSIWFNTVVRGDVNRIRIGRRTNIQDLTMVHADPGVPCHIGRRVGVGHRAILHGCTVEDQCLIGMGSIILNGACIGRGSVIAAGALVPEGMLVPPGSLVMGVPGRIVRPVDEALADRIAGTWVRYVAHAKRHRNGEWPRAAAQ